MDVIVGHCPNLEYAKISHTLTEENLTTMLVITQIHSTLTPPPPTNIDWIRSRLKKSSKIYLFTIRSLL